MNKRVVAMCCAVALTGLTCVNPMLSTSPSSPQTSGSVVVNVSNGDDALAKSIVRPELTGVENVWLTIKQVDVHTSGGNWVTVAQPNARYDFLKLVNGLTVPLNLYPLPAGHYTQIRLILAEDGLGEVGTIPANEIVVNGNPFPIRIPSGIQTGIKCVHQFTIEPNQKTEICLQFDILKAIKYTNGNGYQMMPTYKTIMCDGSQEQTPAPDPTPTPDPTPDPEPAY
jgi:hypothetical protein